MAIEFKLPELGEGVDSADVADIRVSEGDTIEADQNVMELETEKAVMDLPCPHAGKIAKIHVSEGDTIQIGQTLFTIEEAEEKPEQRAEGDERARAEEKQLKPEPKDVPAEQERTEIEETEQEFEQRREAKREPAHAEAETAGPEETKGRREEPEEGRKREIGDGRKFAAPPAGPATRRLARKLHVDLNRLHGSGPGGRITQEDVVGEYTSGVGPRAERGKLPPLPDFSKIGRIEERPLNQIAKTAIEQLSTSWQSIPQVTQQGMADITDVEAARRQFNERIQDREGSVTWTAVVIRAVVAALKEFPEFNSSLDFENERLILKRYYHIGVAVDTERGLLVPVIRNADAKSIVELSVEVRELARKARDRKIGRGEMQDATFTISNQGPIGGNSSARRGVAGTSFTPIVSYPQVAILGMSQARRQLEVFENDSMIRLMLPLSLSYDHRVVNGADAARFIYRLSALLSDPTTALFVY